MTAHNVRWTFHSTGIIADYDAAVGSLARLFGLRVLEYSESEVPEVGRRGGMTWVGDNSIEIGQPLIPGAGAWKFVANNGGGVHSAALQVQDVEATIEHLERLGVPVAARPDPHFFFTDPRATGGVFFEWADIEVAEDPRFGAPEPPFTTEPALEVRHHAFIGALVDDPARWAHRFAELFGTEVTFEDPTAALGAPRAGVSLGDQTLALFALPGADSPALWGRDYQRPRTHLIGLTVPALDDAVATLADQGVGVVARSDRMLVLDPEATGGVAVALVDHLLEGDPRVATGS